MKLNDNIELLEGREKVKTSRLKKVCKIINKQKYLFIMSVPIIIWLVIFAYIPLFGWSFAFVQYKPGRPVLQSDFVGLHHFIQMFQEPRFWNAFKNTVIMAALGISFSGFLFPLIFALLLNELRSITFKRIIQTISYLPYFVSWVVVAGMTLQILSPDGGLLNGLLTSLHIIDKPINFIGVPGYFYAIITSATVWKSIGWNAIIFLSAIAGIDQELYEAAAVDGAGRFRRIWNITLPSIRPTIIILLIMSIGGLVNGGFEAQLLLTNALNSQVTEVLNLYAMKYGINLLRFSYGTAVGIFMSLVSLMLVVLANFIAKKTTEQALF